jgi:hypothetical protein
MSDQCTKVRITQTGGFAGNVALVDLARSRLDEVQSQSMDEACQQLLTFAGAHDTAVPNAATKVGADIPSYRVEIEAKNGETRTFKIPYRAPQNSALGSVDINAIIKQLESLSPSTP